MTFKQKTQIGKNKLRVLIGLFSRFKELSSF
jgi:hypothetical protein